MDIKVLGACCKNSLDTFENTKQAVVDLGIDADVENIGDIDTIMSYGVMSTPALVVDGEVKSVGRKLEVKDLVKLLGKGV